MLLEILTQANGVSGNEKEVRDIIFKEVTHCKMKLN